MSSGVPSHTTVNISYSDSPAIIVPTTIKAPSSGSLLKNAGWRSSDIRPVSGSLIMNSGSLFNYNKTTIVTPLVSTNWSIGAELKASGSLEKVIIYDVGAMPGLYVSGSNSAITVYVSGTNYVWNEWKTIYNPPRTLYSGSVYQIPITFPVPLWGKYVKINASNGALRDPAGNYLRISEIDVRESFNITSISGSKYNEYSTTYSNTLPTGTTQSEINVSRSSAI